MSFLEGREEGTEFRTEVTETRHGDQREAPEMFSAPSVFQWFDDGKG
jgi:hypothetical protein